MKKALIALLGVLVLCIAMVSCQNNVEEKLAEVEFAPAVSKSLNESAEKEDPANTNVDDFYWDYWCDTTTKDKSGIGFKEFSFRKSYDSSTAQYTEWYTDAEAHEMKGLGTIRNMTKGNKYYFGLKGYADAERTQLVWEGYTRVDDTETGEYRSVRITSKTVVQIHVFSKANGKIAYNIKAPYDDDGVWSTGSQSWTTAGTNNDITRYSRYGQSYFNVSWFKVGDPETSGTNTFGYDKDAEGDRYNYFRSAEQNKTSSSNFYGISYDDTSAPAIMSSGVYFFTISQNLLSDKSVVPGRKQVLIVNIAPGAITTIEGSLDSTIGVSVDWDAKNLMIVIFHSTYEEGSINQLQVKQGESALSNYVGVANGNNATFTPQIGTGKNVTWYINGVKLSGSVLAAMKVGDAYQTAWEYDDYGNGLVSASDLAAGVSTDTDDHKIYANEYGSYAYVDPSDGISIVFHRGAKSGTGAGQTGIDKDDAQTSLPDTNDLHFGMEDDNQYLFTAILDEDKDTTTSYSFTVGLKTT